MKYYNETYEYKGYIIEEHYEEDDECIHHNCVVFKNGKLLSAQLEPIDEDSEARQFVESFLGE